MTNRIRNISLLLGLFSLTLVQNLHAQEERSLPDFDAVSVMGNIEVYLEKGESEKAVIYTYDIEEDKLNVFVRNNTLKLQLINPSTYNGRGAKVYITYRQLRGIKAHAGARVISEETITGDKLEVRGASGGQLSLKVAVNALNAGATEGALVEIEGTTESLEVSASTGGQFEGDDLESKRAYVKASTGGVANIVAREKLDASANTGGSIAYSGDPAEKQTRTLLSGEIRKAN
ncbi:MAG TPA: head GIN domain-containing protein [Flavilitoribacter sp.]|nr:head GIN domain-containing protein [Flavilitoribacter sp.]HMQ86173.1 head GIN domain-containing protein [Flavilitoribacter sp.]